MAWQRYRGMNAELFNIALDLLGLSQAGAARYLGLSERQVYRMVHGHTGIPVPISLLLNSLIAHNEQPLVPPRQRPQPLDDTEIPVSVP
jgi:hypothetical protein